MPTPDALSLSETTFPHGATTSSFSIPYLSHVCVQYTSSHAITKKNSHFFFFSFSLAHYITFAKSRASVAKVSTEANDAATAIHYHCHCQCQSTQECVASQSLATTTTTVTTTRWTTTVTTALLCRLSARPNQHMSRRHHHYYYYSFRHLREEKGRFVVG